MKDFDEQKHPRDEEGKFTVAGGETQYRQNTPYEEITGSGKRLSPEEKIASVHIDFTRDNLLPELNEESLAEMGLQKNKKVLLKKSIIDRNSIEHPDLTKDDFQNIVTKALYSPSDIFPANSDKPYFHFARAIEITSMGKSEIGLALLDVDENKDSFEVVHAHFMRGKDYEKAKKKVQKKD